MNRSARGSGGNPARKRERERERRTARYPIPFPPFHPALVIPIGSGQLDKRNRMPETKPSCKPAVLFSYFLESIYPSHLRNS